jgi:S-adenosylmethionine hydrolase
VGSERKGIAIETEIGWLVGPDNGIFSLLLRRFHAQQVRSITPSGPWWQKHSSFDGLHVFAPVAAWLAAEQSPEALGETLAAPQTLAWPDPSREGEWVRGEIVSFDHFGNATSNIPSDWLLPNPSFAGTIRCGRHKNVPLLSHFAAGNPHQLMAMLNSDGLLEFAVNQGSARELGVQLGTQIEVHLQSKTSP